MPTWKIPYSAPKLDDTQLAAARAKYIDKYGYNVVIPGFDDVVHVGTVELMTEGEQYAWAQKDWNYFTEQRILDIKVMKDRKKKAFLKMLGSPVPEIFRARASLITSMDDIQDSISTFTTAMQLIARVLPRLFNKYITGPIGWIMTAGDIINLATVVSTPERASRYVKRVTDSITEDNPFSKKTRLKNTKKLKRGGIKRGALLEVLQTTEGVVGLGISLGALMNLPFEVFYGAAKHLDGYKVSVSLPINKVNFWDSLAARTTKSINTMFATPGIFTLFPQVPALYASNLCQIIMHGLSFTLDDFFDRATVETEVKGQLIKKGLIETYGEEATERFLIEAPKPDNILTIEAIKELGYDPEDGVMWPGTGSRSSTCNDIFESSHPQATKNFKAFLHDQRYSWDGFTMATAAVRGTYFQFEWLGGKGSVEYDYTAACKTIHSMYNAGYRLPFWLTFPSNYWQQGKGYLQYDEQGRQIKGAPILYPDSNIPFDDIQKELWPLPRTSTASLVGDPTTNAVADMSVNTKMLTAYDWSYGGSIHRPATIVKDKLLKYFEEHEENGSTPSTPEFKQFLKDNFYMGLPTNETVETPEEIPKLPLPVEIP